MKVAICLHRALSHAQSEKIGINIFVEVHPT